LEGVLKFFRFILPLALAVSLIAAPAKAEFNGGPLVGNTTLRAADSPYRITDPIEIPWGSSVLIEPGVEIISTAEVLFRLQGGLVISGTAGNPVRISVEEGFIETVQTDAGDPAQWFDMIHTEIVGGSYWDLDAEELYIQHSDIRDQDCDPGYGWLQPNDISIYNSFAKFEGNYFDSACGFNFWISFGVFGPRGTFTVRDNFFDGNPKGTSWVSADSIWGDELNLEGNTFHQPTSTVIEAGLFESPIDANDNYWGYLTIDEARALADGSIGTVFSAPTIALDRLALVPSFAAPTGPNHGPPLPVDPLPWLAGQGPADGDFSAWTKLLANGTQVKFYAKYLQIGQKVQFMVQDADGSYKQIAWKRITASDLGPGGEYLDMQNHIYFIRTIDLKPGKNRVRIYLDGQLYWGTKTYSR
jgi:hypothetical protein